MILMVHFQSLFLVINKTNLEKLSYFNYWYISNLRENIFSKGICRLLLWRNNTVLFVLLRVHPVI